MATGRVVIPNPLDAAIYDADSDQLIDKAERLILSSNDTTADYLGAKVQDTATVSWAVVNDGANEKLEATALLAGMTHDLLSATHPDTTASAVVRGDLITGQGATPKWVALSLGGAGEYLRSDGTDAAWASITMADVTGTKAEFDTSCTDGNFAFDGGAHHDGFSDYVANEHIDHTSVTLTAGEGLTGGGDISANRSFALDYSDLSTTDTAVGGTDLVSIHDGAQKKITFANFEAAISHDNLAGYAIGQHRVINDSGTSTTELWSASKIDSAITAVSNDADIKDAVTTVATSNITLSGNQTINGYLTTNGDRVGVVGQSSAGENGIYIADTGAWSRATDMDADSEISNGTRMIVANTGSTKNGFTYLCTTADPITIGAATSWAEIRRIELGTSAGTAAEGNDSRILTQDENDACVGTVGSPSTSNKFVTNDDTSASGSGTKVPRGTAGVLADSWISVGSVTQHVGSIDHDSLLNYASNEHFTQANITTVGTVTTGNVDAVVSAASLTVAGKVELATTAEIDTGTDSTRAMPIDQYVASDRNIRFFEVILVEGNTDVATGTTLYEWEVPFDCTIIQDDTKKEFFSAWNETAGTTGTMVIDIHKNGTTIMSTNKLDIETGETSTRTATTQPDLTTTALLAGDKLQFDVDSTHTTPAKGLTVRVPLRMT